MLWSWITDDLVFVIIYEICRQVFVSFPFEVVSNRILCAVLLTVCVCKICLSVETFSTLSFIVLLTLTISFLSNFILNSLTVWSSMQPLLGTMKIKNLGIISDLLQFSKNSSHTICYELDIIVDNWSERRQRLVNSKVKEDNNNFFKNVLKKMFITY